MRFGSDLSQPSRELSPPHLTCPEVRAVAGRRE
jgi:hypothetical protein